jgi:hypothetical protein
MFTASPDVVCVLEYTTEGWATQDERPLARDVRKMPKMSEQTVMPATPVHDKEGRPPPGLGQVEISQEATLVVQEVKPVVQGTFATTDRQDHPTRLMRLRMLTHVQASSNVAFRFQYGTCAILNFSLCV